MPQSTSRVGKRGTVVIPAALRRRFGIEEGSLIIIAEDREEGILIRPAAAVPRKSTLRRGGRSFCSRAPWTKRTTRAPKKRSVRWGSTPTPSRTVVGLRAARIPKRGLNLFGRQRPLFCVLPLRRRLTQALEAGGGADSNLRIRGRGSSQEPEPTPAT
jgi:AbrB family looped-hinge helix DNA binding protein